MNRNANRLVNLLALLVLIYLVHYIAPSAGWPVYAGVVLFWWGFSHLMYRSLRN
jgi:hypothetical protein